MLMDKLIRRIIELQSPIVVGLDPRLSQIPGHIKEEIFSSQGKTPEAAAAIIYRFNQAIINHIYDLVPAVKPQIALYEQFGVPGINCYINTVEYAKSKGLLVIGDIKRGDIASTAEAYSHGHIGKVDVEGTSHDIFREDFITVSPYMGHDSVEPYLADCSNYGKGIFVLVKTSNPGSADIQDIVIVGGETSQEGLPIYLRVGKLVSEWGRNLIGEYGFSSIGAVVGATHPEEGKVLRENMPHTFFLVPGYGAQGGTAKDLQGMFNKDRLGIIVNSSRGITGAFQSETYKDFGEDNFAQAARAAVLDMRKDLMP